jgi:hypothetical protein
MSSRRAEGDDLDSLNLLLDTVCNMFGIFIFSALIVAIMAVTRTTQVVTSAAPDAPDGEIAERIAAEDRRVDALQRRLEEIAASRGTEYRLRAAEARDRLSSVDEEVERRKRVVEEYDARIKAGAEFLAGLGATLPALRQEIAALEAEVRRAREVKEVEARTPLRRAMEGRVPVQVVLDEDRAFVLNPWWELRGPAHHPCDVWSRWNAQAVDVAASECDVVRCDRGGGIEIHRKALLLRDGGLPAQSPEVLAKERRWASFLDALDPARHVVTIRCTRTGFRAFGPVRATIVSRGIPYNVEAVRLDPFYRDSIVEGTPVGQ